MKKGKTARMKVLADLIFTDETFQPSGTPNIPAEVEREMKDGTKPNQTNKRPKTNQIHQKVRFAAVLQCEKYPLVSNNPKSESAFLLSFANSMR